MDILNFPRIYTYKKQMGFDILYRVIAFINVRPGPMSKYK